MLSQMSFMNADRIREDIFLSSKQDSSSTDNFWTMSTFENARYELLSSSLIRRNIEKKELAIHRVIQNEARTRLSESARYHIFNEAVALMANLWLPGDLITQAIQRWPLCEDLLPHLERFYQLYEEHSGAWKQFTVNPTLVNLMHEAAV
jgi:hypothetical protein